MKQQIAFIAAQLRRLPLRKSLPAKLLTLVGLAGAAALIIALVIPWFRMKDLVAAGQGEAARSLFAAWLDLPPGPDGIRPRGIGTAVVRQVPTSRAIAEYDPRDPVARAIRRLGERPELPDAHLVEWEGWARRSTLVVPTARDPDGTITEVAVLTQSSVDAGRRLAVNTLTLIAAGCFVLAAALVVYAVITARLVLRPLRTLRDWAARVESGDVSERVELGTGDELQDLAHAFSRMLDTLEERETKLRAINAAMDIKLNELSEANEELDQAAKVKNEFLGNVSHELRTPLNSIIGFADLLTEMVRRDVKDAKTGAGEVPPGLFKRQRYLENIAAAARDLLELIDGLLEMAKLEAGRIELNTEPVDPAHLCRGLVGMIEPLAQRKGVAVTLETPPGVPLITTDRRKVQQIVFNLLSNAVKFTDPTTNRGQPGRVTVRTERLAAASGSEEPRVRISVLDNGPGVPPEDQEVIFEKFKQLRAGHDRAHGGTGLGLTISKELATILGGEMQLVSEPGRGSMFSLILPLAPAEPTPRRLPSRPTD